MTSFLVECPQITMFVQLCVTHWDDRREDTICLFDRQINTNRQEYTTVNCGVYWLVRKKTSHQ
ncbi:hypothetical protein JM189_04635 [Wolbachia endosymbiont of Nasonia vitripennis]|uniref:hypothetical protein n=1 Tax=Wolbachia endosymbiont of Nomada ferruginata TaxID=1854761 RepID=UPI001428D678|nr:hypothetical protein [Wolbachia endosymbiont of Nomada ferruginata]